MRNITTTTLNFNSVDAAVEARDMAIEAGGHVGTSKDLHAVHMSRIGFDGDEQRYTVEIVDNPDDSRFYTWTDVAVDNYRAAMFSLHMDAVDTGDQAEADRAADLVQESGREMVRRGMW